MTNHPKDLSDELINEIASNNKICKHIHLPLQSASDRILKLMNRKYIYEQYKNLVFKIKSKIPNINITSDIIVGFPTETNEDFQKTFEAAKELQFGGLFIFKYSPRPKTFALQFKDDVSAELKQERLSVLLEESNKISKKINSNYINKKIDVLVESFQDNICCGRNGQNLKVFFPSKENLTGKNIEVNVDTALANSLSGKMVI
jgi:MiaB/RimO family radical SAM methylthiotransferase